MRKVGSALAASIVGLIGVGCAGGFGPTGTGGLGGAACPQLQGGALGADYGLEARLNATLGAFVQAASDLATTAVQVEQEVGAACTRMGGELGVDPASMQMQVGRGGRVEGACRPVLARIDAILQQGASAQMRVSYTPPSCQVAGDVYASCKGSCDVRIDPGYIIANCEPGKLSGQCVGTCQGKCDGTCNGDCQGTCSAKNAQGQCAGKCSGTCHGSCDATCNARCQGEWRAPKCATEVKAPQADARCDGACRAHADITARCSEPKVDARAQVDTGELPKLAAALRASLPALVRAEISYGQRLADDVRMLVQTGAELPAMVGQASARAYACAAASANAVANAQASLRVSVNVSASVTGRVGGRVAGQLAPTTFAPLGRPM